MRPHPRRRPQARRQRALGLGADQGGTAADLPPRLRDRGPVLQRAALAGLPYRARHARALLRQFARYLYHSYSWDIAQREQVESTGPIDLRSWTRDQIFDEAWQALMRVWKDRDSPVSYT